MNMDSKLEVGDHKYRALFEDPNAQVITLSHLFDGVNNAGLGNELGEILSAEHPIRILVEGSAYPRNLDVVGSLLQNRRQTRDEIDLIDVSEDSIYKHKAHAVSTASQHEHVSNILRGNMNAIPLPNSSVDLLINDCAINFNKTDPENRRTLSEIRRVLKPRKSAALLTTVVDYQYDNPKFGVDQENVPASRLHTPGYFISFKPLKTGG